MKWWEHLVTYVLLVVAAATIGGAWAVEWERSTRPQCPPFSGNWRLVASYEKREEVACMYVLPTALWGQAVKRDILKRRKGT